MNNTTNGNRKHIAIFGNTNAGKSSIMNAILNQDISLVSEVKGTTTDVVKKAMELIPVGPVLFIDTPGLNDNTVLGEKREERAFKALKSTDVAIFVLDGEVLDIDTYKEFKLLAKKYNISFITVVNKKELLEESKVDILKKEIKDLIFISVKKELGIDVLKEKLIEVLENEEDDKSLIADLVPYGGSVIMVVPIDSEAPKGRLILPQVQLLRDCLDSGIKSYVVRDTELSSALEDIKNIDLVITDSQAFKKVSDIVPNDIKLTSFSILFARQKGDLKTFVDGVNQIRNLKQGSKILISESCSHNVSHEDIGKVKIPKLLEKFVGGKLDFTFRMGNDFPDDIEKYDLIIHCGACMINRKTVMNRIDQCNEKNVKITNYGVVLAFLSGIIDRALI